MQKLLSIFVLSLFLLIGCESTTQSNSGEEYNLQGIEDLKSEIQIKHPVTYFELAGQLLKEGKMDEAAVWYYVGQIRYRAYLTANPGLEPSGDPALYGSLKYVLGTPINEYAGSNPDNWVKLIEQAIQWHHENPNLFTPKDTHSEIYSEIEAGFIEFRDSVESSKEEIRKQRAANGLQNS
jgi:uncharacterized protein YcfL